MNDPVERQAAIDALGDEPEVWTGKDKYAQGLNNQWHYDRNALLALPSAEPQYEELAPEEAASEIASGSIISASYWLNRMIQIEQMGYAICRKR